MAKTYECTKCHGTGTIGFYSHIAGGVCFQCKGEGRISYKPTQKFVEPHPELLVPAHLRASEAQWTEIETLCSGDFGCSDDAFCTLVEAKAGGQACLKYLTAERAAKAIEIGKTPAWRQFMRKRYGIAA